MGRSTEKLRSNTLAATGSLWFAVGRFLEPFTALDRNTGLFHQRAGAVPAYIMSIFAQLPGHSTRTIAPPCTAVDLPDPGKQEKVSVHDMPIPISQILVKPTPAYPHHLAQSGYREGLHLLPDKAESYFDRLAKKAVAFFNMSRSISRRLTSLRSRCSSSFSGVMNPLPGKGLGAFFFDLFLPAPQNTGIYPKVA